MNLAQKPDFFAPMNVMTSVTQTRYYLTKAGLKRVQEEYGRLIEFRNSKIEEVPSMLHSEEVNPEYLTFQEDMSLLETKIAEYDAVLRNAEVIKVPPKEKRTEILIGASVTVEIDGQSDEFTIVGSLEANPAIGRISDESPVGKALLGKKI